MKAKNNRGRLKKKLALRLFVEPRLTKRGSLKEVTFITAPAP
ncbi:MAG: hypothetical protein PHT41_05095 [Candidatus Omnitrophica bacterium]|nr:hypothetical protein [Candidatus Omnitrophota bacterium]MDD5238311.1 hypothetical protein [Candidatus Omnitrophota bacterium]